MGREVATSMASRRVTSWNAPTFPAYVCRVSWGSNFSDGDNFNNKLGRRTMEERGVVKVVFEKGFGFIRDRFGAEHFFHARQCDDGLFESLKPGDEVIYHLAMGRSGRPCAEGVKRAAA